GRSTAKRARSSPPSRKRAEPASAQGEGPCRRRTRTGMLAGPALPAEASPGAPATDALRASGAGHASAGRAADEPVTALPLEAVALFGDAAVFTRRVADAVVVVLAPIGGKRIDLSARDEATEGDRERDAEGQGQAPDPHGKTPEITSMPLSPDGTNWTDTALDGASLVTKNPVTAVVSPTAPSTEAVTAWLLNPSRNRKASRGGRGSSIARPKVSSTFRVLMASDATTPPPAMTSTPAIRMPLPHVCWAIPRQRPRSTTRRGLRAATGRGSVVMLA